MVRPRPATHHRRIMDPRRSRLHVNQTPVTMYFRAADAGIKGTESPEEFMDGTVYVRRAVLA